MSTQFTVKAKENSVSGGAPVNTGVAVQPGLLLTITVPPDELWSAGTGDRKSNANGLHNPLGGDFGTFDKGPFAFLYGSLVGSLDGGKTFFPVGTRMEMTVLAKGNLSLYYWDVNHDDNSGSVTATVETYKL
ncbi:MAG TPA: hypothetical protein VHG32_05450 [Thermoanaerobaculia bacterium]|jgi:hypothetical protein|nr:hypothetical protein [Thermoanaerobaculia bacterium]